MVIPKEGNDVRNVTAEADRFWSKVDTSSECWLWLAAQSRNGYGRFGRADGRTIMAHRVAYEYEVGPIPEGLQIDHLCRVRLCVRPDHLEAVTQQINIARANAANGRREKCKHGHEFTKANTYVTPDGRWQCRTCIRWRLERCEAKRVAQGLPARGLRAS